MCASWSLSLPFLLCKSWVSVSEIKRNAGMSFDRMGSRCHDRWPHDPYQVTLLGGAFQYPCYSQITSCVKIQNRNRGVRGRLSPGTFVAPPLD
ncbi:hypothetical protein BJ741DRAFT_591403 [Chytriomyces cf. hyalinus JEL632]|nr:hypothetical protein BJ741DRAFT_591403 [Chytriomyces cf. hyalinus JEL632]